MCRESVLGFPFVLQLLLLGIVEWAGSVVVSLTFIKLGVLWEPCGSEPGTGLFGFNLCRRERVKQKSFLGI